MGRSGSMLFRLARTKQAVLSSKTATFPHPPGVVKEMQNSDFLKHSFTTDISVL